MKQAKFVLAIGVLVAVVAAGGIVFFQAAKPVQATESETAVAEGSGVLDGMTFSSELGPIGKPANVKDFLIFENGMFVSKECERQCGYPPAAYFVRRVGAKIEFVSETHCSANDATIVWRGTVDDGNGTISGMFTWTSARWYWTIEKEFWFEGTLADVDTPVADDSGVPIASDQ